MESTVIYLLLHYETSLKKKNPQTKSENKWKQRKKGGVHIFKKTVFSDFLWLCSDDS